MPWESFISSESWLGREEGDMAYLPWHLWDNTVKYMSWAVEMPDDLELGYQTHHKSSICTKGSL